MLYLSPGITIYCLVLAAVLGACAGSFLNCMAWRIVHEEPFLKGRSHCDVCGHVLSAGDLIPIVSYLAHRGKCRYCGAKLSIRHVIYEALSAVVFVTLLLRFDISPDALQYILLACLLMGAAFADIEGYIIPDGFILAGVALRLVFILLSGHILSDLTAALIGGFAVALALLLVVLVMEKVLGREAMGGGDIKLIFMLGLFLGWQKNILCVLIACLLGIVTAVLTQKQREQNSEDQRIFPWGPSLAIAAYLTLLFGDALLNAYLSLF